MPLPQTSHRLARFSFALLCAGYSVVAIAQWAWKDDNGRLVFSDNPPPASIKANQIVRQPKLAAPVLALPAETKPDAMAAAPAAVSKPPADAAGPKTLAERDMDFRKLQQERAAAEKKASEEQGRRQQLAQDCERSRGYLQALHDGRRIAQTDAQGNQVILDDAARASEVERIRARLARDCSN